MRGAHVRRRPTKKGHVWQIIVEQEPDPKTGKRNRIFKTMTEGATKKDAEEMLRYMLTELDNQTYVKDTNITVTKYFKEWLETYISPHKSPTTIDSYDYNVQHYILPKFGNLKLQNLSTIEIQKWFNELAVKSPLSNNPLSSKTIRNIYMNLNAALKRAVKLELIKKNPAESIELPKCKKYRAEIYNAEELRLLIEAARGTDMELAIMILVCCGIRRGELLALQWKHIDFDNSIISIENNLVRSKGKPVTKDPKSASGKRKIEAPDILMKLLRQAKIEYAKNKLMYGAGYNDSNLIVCQQDGNPFYPDWFSKKFIRFLQDNGLKHIRLHDLRHSHITFMLRLGVSVKIMQQIAGHSTFNTTMDTYSHVLDDMQKEAAELLNNGLQDLLSKAQ
jgi:integrase